MREMVSGAVTARPGSRPTTSGGGKMNLPVIAHPRANMASMSADLSVRGESRLGHPPAMLGGMARMQTFVSMDGGNMQTGLDRSNLPPLTERMGTASPTHSIIRMSVYGNAGDITVRNLGDKGKFRRNIAEARQFDEDEIYLLVQEKLTTGYHGLKHLFKSNDPHGQGVVTREALLKILYSLIGHVTIEKYHKFLKGLNLADKSQISFDLFVSRFRDNETVCKEWVSPVLKKDIHTGLAAQHPEEHLRYTGFTTRNGFISAAYCFAQLRDKARSRAIDVSSMLPGSCTEAGGMILAPHLFDLVKKAGLKLTDEEFKKLWERYDLHGAGAVRTAVFYNNLGLDEFGFPRPQTTPKIKIMDKVPENAQLKGLPAKTEPVKSESNAKQKQVAECVGEKEEKEAKKEEQMERKSPEAEKIDRKLLMSRKSKTPKLEKIIDCLAYKFEEPYNNMMSGMKCFDFLGDGLIAKIDMKRVLAEFGLPVGSIELDHFLSRCSMRSVRGQVAYKDFLMKFWNRSDTGLVNRIVTNSFHMFGQDILPAPHGNQLTVEELEARFIDFLHGDFLRLLGTVRKMDKYSIGVVTQHEFKYAVERTLGYKITDQQWEELKETVGLDSDGLVPYPKFLEKFNISPGSWNKREVGGFKVTQVNQVSTPAAVLRLQQEALREQQAREAKQAEERRQREEEERLLEERRKQQAKEEMEKTGHGRSVHKLTEMLQVIFRTKFHAIDQAFKAMDRRMTGRFAKHQLAELVKVGGVELSPCEVDALWDSFQLSSDGMFNFTTLVRHFTDYGKVVHQFCPATEPKPPPPEASPKPQQRRIEENPYKTFAKNDGTTKANRNQDVNTLNASTRIGPQVLAHWDKLKAIFHHLDRAGHAKILAVDIKDILVHMKFGLSNPEIEHIIGKYDLNKDGYFHYIEFLKSYMPDKTQEKAFAFDKHSFKMEQKTAGSTASWQVESPTISQIIDRVRTKLIKDHKNIRRAFKKADSKNCGVLSVADFKNVLKSCNISVSGEDLYHLLTEFDSNMNGFISYEDFLSTMLSTI